MAYPALDVGWGIVVRAGWAGGRLLPPPSRIAATLRSLSEGSELLFHIGAALWRVALGFLIGTWSGILIGAAAGYSHLFRTLVDPSIQGLRAIPSLQ